MAFTFNGIGTTYYGQRDFGPEGSYVTTEWFVVLFVPLIPIKSLRVLDSNEWNPFYASYKVLSEDDPSIKQVISTYFFAFFYIALVALAFVLWWAWYYILLAIIAPWILVVCLREYDRSSAQSAQDYSPGGLTAFPQAGLEE